MLLLPILMTHDDFKLFGELGYCVIILVLVHSNKNKNIILKKFQSQAERKYHMKRLEYNILHYPKLGLKKSSIEIIKDFWRRKIHF